MQTLYSVMNVNLRVFKIVSKHAKWNISQTKQFSNLNWEDEVKAMKSDPQIIRH